jgi:hypothetical protein
MKRSFILEKGFLLTYRYLLTRYPHAMSRVELLMLVAAVDPAVGDCHPLARFFFLFSSAETREKGVVLS